MARFRTPLHTLLRTRRQAEQIRQRSVAELERRRIEIEDTLRTQQRFISEGKESLRDRLRGSLEMDSLRMHAGATVRVMRRAGELAVELAGVYKRLEAARMDLLEATKGRRSVELLCERRRDAWRRRIEKAEETALDELATQAAARKET